MKKIAQLFFVCLTSNLFGQGVLEKLFYLLPSEYCMNLDEVGRKDEMNQMKENYKNGERTIGFIDEKNGYLCTASVTQCSFEMCYWSHKYNDGSGGGYKIIGVERGLCRGSTIFFKEVNGILMPYTPEVLASFNALFFFKDGVKIEEIRGLAGEFYLSLPSKGTTITVFYGSGGLDKELKKKNLLRGDKINLIWNNGNGEFSMGEPYF